MARQMGERYLHMHGNASLSRGRIKAALYVLVAVSYILQVKWVFKGDRTGQADLID